MASQASPTVFDNFGGLVTLVGRTDLSGPGPSPSCRNVVFGVGRVGKRPGLTSLFTAISGTPKIAGIYGGGKWMSDYNEVAILGGNGKYYEEYPAGTLVENATRFGSEIRPTWAKSGANLFMLVSDGSGPSSRPFRIRSRPTTGFPEVYSLGLPGNVGAPTAAEVVTAGNVTAGAHQIVVVAENPNGDWGAPSAAVTVTATGSRQIQVTAFPTGAPVSFWSMSYRVFMTAAGGSTFYYAGINTGTVPFNINVSDAYLLASTRLDYPTNYTLSITPPSCAAVFGPLNGRIWLAQPTNALWREAVAPDGTFANQNIDCNIAQSGGYYPAGWTGTGGGTTFFPYTSGYNASSANHNLYYYFTGAGGSISRALDLTRIAASQNERYNVRIRCRKSAGAASGGISVSLDNGTTSSTVLWSGMGTEWQTFELALGSRTSDPSFGTIVISGATTGGEQLAFNWVEIVPESQPIFRSSFLVSDPTSQGMFITPGSYLSIDEGDGDAVTNAFDLGGRRYVCKNRALYYVVDDGNQAAYWTYQKIATNVGTTSFNGVGLADQFAVICGKAGAYLFTGGGISDEAWISQEIKPTWDTINWTYGHTIWCRVDTEQKRVYIGAPVSTAVEPSTIFVCDYTEGWDKRKWTLWDINANCGELVVRSDGTRQFWLGNNGGTGKIYKLDDTALSDDGTAIESWYELTPIGLTPGLTLLERIIGDLHGYCTTTGTSASLSVSLLDYAGNETVQAYSPTLTEPANGLTQILTHFIGEKTSVKIKNLSSDAWWQMNRLAMYQKPFRGIVGRPFNP